MYGWYLFHKRTRGWLKINDPQAEYVDVVATPAEATAFDTHEQAREVLAYFTGNPNFPDCEVIDATIPAPTIADADQTPVKTRDEIMKDARERSEAEAALAREQRFHNGGEGVLLPRYGAGGFTLPDPLFPRR